MAFFKDRFVIVTNSLKKFYMFQWQEGHIYLYFFNPRIEKVEKTILADNAFKEFDVSIDENDIIYVVYQDESFNLILSILNKNNIDTIKLTQNPIPEVYNLNIINCKDTFHIIYCEEELDERNSYLIYHHFFDGNDWFTNEVEKISVKKILNPFQLAYKENKVLLSYYDLIEKEEIYLKSFDCQKKKWEEKHKLTDKGRFKLYLDFLILNEKLNLVYSEKFEGNFRIKYERYDLSDGKITKEVEEIISNPENCSHPTLVFFNKKLWVVWLEYENVLSRYSEDLGSSWSPIYLWKESKRKNIVKYQYLQNNSMNNVVLNTSFGKVYPDVSFIGFGPLENTIEVPLKKKGTIPIRNIRL